MHSRFLAAYLGLILCATLLIGCDEATLNRLSRTGDSGDDPGSQVADSQTSDSTDPGPYHPGEYDPAISNPDPVGAYDYNPGSGTESVTNSHPAANREPDVRWDSNRPPGADEYGSYGSTSGGRPSGGTSPRPAQQQQSSGSTPDYRSPSGSSSGSRSSSQVQFDLSAGVALAQTGPEGTMMTFSVDYQLTAGQLQSNAVFALVIRPKRGQALMQTMKFGQMRPKGNIPVIVPQWRPDIGPFEAFIVDHQSKRVSNTEPLHTVGGGF